MKKLDTFKLDRNKDPIENIFKIKKFIDSFTKQKIILQLSKNYSEILDCPNRAIDKKLKQLTLGTFHYQKGIFLFKSGPIMIFRDFLINAGIILVSFLFSKKVKKRKKCQIILDDIEDVNSLFRFKKLLSYYKESVVFTKKIFYNSNFKTISNSIKYSYFFIPSSVNIKKNTFSLVCLSFKILFLSIKNNFNLFYFFNKIIFTYLRYEYLFEKYNSKYLLHDRFYRSCSLRNHLFKKKGGSLIGCTQIHIPEASISLYFETDILFSFGNESYSKNKINKLGGSIKKVVPVGSLKMEHLWNGSKKYTSRAPSSDIILIGLNPMNWLKLSKRMVDNYYTQYEWMKKLSKKFPDYKIIIKHHPNFKGDDIESNILKDTKIKSVINSNFLKKRHAQYSNIKKFPNLFFRKFNISINFIDDLIFEKNSDSYNFMNSSRIVLSFGSTMILEGVGMNKKSFFLDPKKQNTTFFKYLNHLNSIRITNYNQLEKVVINISKSKNIKKSKRNQICLESSQASKKIFNYFNKSN